MFWGYHHLRKHPYTWRQKRKWLTSHMLQCNMTINLSQIQENMPWTRWFKSWPFYPRSLEVTIYLWKGRLTIPKGAQRIARCFRFLWYCLKIYPCSCFIVMFNHDTFWKLIHLPYFLHNTPNFHEFSSHFKNTEHPKIPSESSHGLHLPPPGKPQPSPPVANFLGVRGSQRKNL